MTSRQVRTDPVLLDTGPLLTYLALRYADWSSASRAYRDTLFRDIRKQGPRFSETEQERFSKLIETRHALTTPHVIMEATRLREHSELARVENFREFSLEVLTSSAISEIWCSLEEICKEPKYMDLVLRFGVADASLLFISARDERLLLTDENRLFAAYGAGGSKFEIWRLDKYLSRAGW
jgi:hypothetical protein